MDLGRHLPIPTTKMILPPLSLTIFEFCKTLVRIGITYLYQDAVQSELFFKFLTKHFIDLVVVFPILVLVVPPLWAGLWQNFGKNVEYAHSF